LDASAVLNLNIL